MAPSRLCVLKQTLLNPFFVLCWVEDVFHQAQPDFGLNRVMQRKQYLMIQQLLYYSIKNVQFAYRLY